VDTPLFATEPPPAPRGERSYSVAEFNRLLGSAVSELFPDDLWVEGEISNLTRSRVGHVYFDLVEPSEPGVASTAKISVVLFNQTKQIVNNQLKRQNVGRLVDGMAVRVRAAVDFYEARGSLQLRMTGIDPRYVLAAMAAERDALLHRLHAEGITARNGQLPMPLVPLRVGLVTSAGSAASADFLEELQASGLGFRVTACDTRVQGDLAPHTLVAALATVCRHPVDVVVLIRGGGSRGDLAVFDNEELARSIADAPVPVLTGIGHEIDTSVADAVAHTALKTPTAVAAELVRHVTAYIDRAEGRWETIRALALTHSSSAERALLERARRAALAGREGTTLALQQLDERARRTARASHSALGRASMHLVHVQGQIPRAVERRLRLATSEIDHVDALVRAADPAVLLRRGWSITRNTNGDVVRSTQDVAPGDTLVTEIADGSIISNVSVVDSTSTNASSPPAASAESTETQ